VEAIVSSILRHRPGDLTPHICKRCHRVIVEDARVISDRGTLSYEHIYDCLEASETAAAREGGRNAKETA